jgi:hypothetical protein
MQRLALPAPTLPESAPVERSFAQIRAELMAQIAPVLTATWPPQAPFKDFDLVFAKNAFLLNVWYRSDDMLDPIALDMITKDLQEKLKAPGLSINAIRIPANQVKPKSAGRVAKSVIS